MRPKTAFLFPGQGSQYVGMGKDVLENLSEGRQLFQIAEKVTGVPVAELCLEGPLPELTKTRNLQPCLTAVDILSCMAARHVGLDAQAVAGHSLGEYPALWAAGVVSTGDCFRLVKERGRLMDEAAVENPGAMAAIIGMERGDLEQLVKEVAAPGEILALANHNSRKQIVVTGHKDAVHKLCSMVKKAGKKAIVLKVAGAYHSPLMQEASDVFSRVLKETGFKNAQIPVYSNVTAEPETDAERFKGLMSEQICSPVRWYEIINNMYRDGVRNFIELGPKKVLANLAKACLDVDDAMFFSADSLEDLNSVKEELQG